MSHRNKKTQESSTHSFTPIFTERHPCLDLPLIVFLATFGRERQRRRFGKKRHFHLESKTFKLSKDQRRDPTVKEIFNSILSSSNEWNNFARWEKKNQWDHEEELKDTGDTTVKRILQHTKKDTLKRWLHSFGETPLIYHNEDYASSRLFRLFFSQTQETKSKWKLLTLLDSWGLFFPSLELPVQLLDSLSFLEYHFFIGFTWERHVKEIPHLQNISQSRTKAK